MRTIIRAAKLQPKDVGSRPNGRSSAAYLAGDLIDGSAIRDFPGKRIILVAGPGLGTRLHSYVTSSPSAPAVVAVNRRLSEQLSARHIPRFPEVRCDGPAPVEVRERSLSVSLPFPLALAVSLLSSH